MKFSAEDDKRKKKPKRKLQFGEYELQNKMVLFLTERD